MNVTFVLRELFNDFISLIFPKICIHCGTTLVHQEEYICMKCRLSLPKTNFHLEPENSLKQKLIYEPKVRGAAAYLNFNKRGIAQTIVHNLKYMGYDDLGVLVGRWYGEDLRKQAKWAIDYIVPVPLHRSKLKKRGYNQSERFAVGLADTMCVEVKDDLVIRTVRTNTQTKKSKVERLQNVDCIYKIIDPTVLAGKVVLIVDDVITTGATIGELAVLLAENGVEKIYVAAIATGK